MNIESIGIQKGAAQAQTQGAKSAAANDPLAALFAEFLGIADALVAGGSGEAARKTDDPSAQQQGAQLVGMMGTPFLPLPVAAQAAAAAQNGTTGAAAAQKVTTGATAAVAATAGKTASASAVAAGVPGAALPIELSKQDAAAPATTEAAQPAAAEGKLEAKPGDSAKTGAKPDVVLPSLAINLAPNVALAAPKIQAPEGAVKAKPAASTGAAAKSTTPVSVTVEKAPAPAQSQDEAHRAEAPAPVAGATPAAPKDEAATAPAKPDVTAPAPTAAPVPQTVQVPVDAKAAQPQPAVPLHTATQQLVHQVEKAIEHGEDRIRIELKPASLGGVEVHLHIADDGRVSAIVRADRADTLALLQNDVRGLEQALKDAGLRPDAGSLSFNLRQGEGQAGHQPDARGQRRRGNSERATFAIEGVGSKSPDVRDLVGGLDIRI